MHLNKNESLKKDKTHLKYYRIYRKRENKSFLNDIIYIVVVRRRRIEFFQFYIIEDVSIFRCVSISTHTYKILFGKHRFPCCNFKFKHYLYIYIVFFFHNFCIYKNITQKMLVL